MEIIDKDKLMLFILFVMPGLITLKVYNLICPTRKEELGQQVIDAITYSCVNYAFNAIFIYLVETSDLKNVSIFDYWLFYIYILFIFPIILGIVWWKIRSWPIFQRNAPHPTKSPWDFVFKKQTPCWIVVTLNDGKKIGGRYGLGSFTSSFPEEPQIYLDECWHLNADSGFDRKKDRSGGIIILSKDIQSVEIFSDN